MFYFDFKRVHATLHLAVSVGRPSASMNVCLSVCLSVRPSVCLSISLSIRPSICPSVRPSVRTNVFQCCSTAPAQPCSTFACFGLVIFCLSFFFAGACAGSCCMVLVYPLDYARTRMANDAVESKGSKRHYKGGKNIPTYTSHYYQSFPPIFI